MPDIEKDKDIFQSLASGQVTLCKRAPFRLFGLRRLGKTVSRQVDKGDFAAVDRKIVEQTRAPGLRRGARQFAVAREKVDEGRLARIGFTRKGDFGRAEIRQLSAVRNGYQKFRGLSATDTRNFAFFICIGSPRLDLRVGRARRVPTVSL